MKLSRALFSSADYQDIVKSWQDIHAMIFTKASIITSLSEEINLSTYYYTIYKTFGREQDLVHAQTLFAQSVGHATSSAQFISSQSIEDLTGIAQLAHWFAENGQLFREAEDLLGVADKQLLIQAQQLLTAYQADQAPVFFSILRYFYLRLPSSGVVGALDTLFQRAQAAYSKHEWTQLLPSQDELTKAFTPLGLADGLAGQALQLIKLYKAGVRQPILLKAIQVRILAILSTRREVDFSEGIYSMFPDAVSPATDEAQTQQELTWRSGDLGQALVLYEACALLQDEELAWLAELVGLNTLLRKDERTTGIRTAEFCTGAAGTAHLYHQLHRASGNPAYEVGYHYWIKQTQQLLLQELENGIPQQQRDLRYNLISVGLVLLSAVAVQHIEWDQRLY